MKKFLRNLVVEALSYLSRITLAKHKPIVIAITGNIGKTTTKDYIYSFLKYKFKNEPDKEIVRASDKSQNSEIGMNLTILGEKNAWDSPLDWLKIIFKSYFRTLTQKVYPEILVLEVGADKPRDISYLTTIINPDVVVLTAFQKSPTHGEFFYNIDQHINEKKVLVDKMKADGFIIYNADDEVMSKMAITKKSETPTVNIFSFGYDKGSNICILDYSNLYDEDAEIIGQKIKLGIRFNNIKEEVEIRLNGVVGSAQAYSVASAVCVSVLNEFNKEDILNASKSLDFSKSRMRVLDGVVDTKIIDDSYNASPKAMQNAIETVSGILCKGKKIAILGHMAELGKKTQEEHFNIGMLAAKTFDLVLLSGRYNEFYLEGLREGKIDLGKVYLTKDAYEVLQTLSDNQLIDEHDLILVKGSQSARLEKVVVELLRDDSDRSKVCRQEVEWVNR